MCWWAGRETHVDLSSGLDEKKWPRASRLHRFAREGKKRATRFRGYPAPTHQRWCRYLPCTLKLANEINDEWGALTPCGGRSPFPRPRRAPRNRAENHGPSPDRAATHWRSAKAAICLHTAALHPNGGNPVGGESRIDDTRQRVSRTRSGGSAALATRPGSG